MKVKVTNNQYSKEYQIAIGKDNENNENFIDEMKSNLRIE